MGQPHVCLDYLNAFHGEKDIKEQHDHLKLLVCAFSKHCGVLSIS